MTPFSFSLSEPYRDAQDNAFIFTNDSLPVPKRRKYFAQEKHRTDFVYDPDVVYGASFFSDVMNFNTFDLAIVSVLVLSRRPLSSALWA